MKLLSQASLFCGILAAVFILLTIVLPPNAATIKAYNLSTAEYKILTILVNIPVMVVWFGAFYGYASLQTYSELIRKTADGQAFSTISRGVKWLAWGLPASTIVTSVLGGIVHGHPQLTATAFIILHYIPLVISLFAFTYISSGSHMLMDITKSRPTLSSIRLAVGILSIIGVLYTYLTLQDAGPSGAPYYMPVWLVVITVIIPYLYAWFIGLIAAYEIYIFSKRAKGFLYKRALDGLAAGMAIATLTSIILQYIGSDTTHIRKITLNGVFLGVYVILILYAVGFVLIALGAKRLRKIEEV